ncbi:MAG: biotin--[acetyl-CoA-carboxylase] ligase [SAR324 cluster bacterium]|nr:biotin--[acetyl-CoA-carboxylase] ligase [SAR324 cluster bacterium]
MLLPTRIIYLAETESTNLHLLQSPDLLEINGLVVTAETQTAGRGRRGKKWETGPKGQLYFSLCLHTSGYPCPDHSFTLIAGLALAKAFEEYKTPNLSIKWPNDLLVNSKKLAGILCEGFSGGMVIGIGVNLIGEPVDFGTEVQNKITTLQSATNLIKTPTEVILNFCGHFQKCLQKIKLNGLDSSLKEWEAISSSINSEIYFEDQGTWKEGITKGLGPAGELLVESCGKLTSLFSGETSLTPPPLD